jgi:hypothetical protein
MTIFWGVKNLFYLKVYPSPSKSWDSCRLSLSWVGRLGWSAVSLLTHDMDSFFVVLWSLDGRSDTTGDVRWGHLWRDWFQTNPSIGCIKMFAIVAAFVRFLVPLWSPIVIIGHSCCDNVDNSFGGGDGLIEINHQKASRAVIGNLKKSRDGYFHHWLLTAEGDDSIITSLSMLWRHFCTI